MNDTLRPDERASLRQIDTSRENLGLLKKGIGLAAGAAGFAGATSRILPFLDQLVPSSLAIKGLKKVDKRIGSFIDHTLENGFSGDSIIGFLRDQFTKKEPSKSSNPLQDFETSYPDIAQALSGYINQGQSPDAAAGILKTSSAFGKKINQLEKEVGKNFVDYVLELFGPGSSQGQIQQNPQQMQPQTQQSQQPQQGQGGIDPQLAQLMQGIRASIQNLRGNP